MRGKRPDSAQLLLRRFDGEAGLKPLSSDKIRKENYRRPNGRLGDFLIFRRLIENCDVALSEIQLPQVGVSADFVSRGAGQLRSAQKRQLIEFLNTRCQKPGLNIPENVFDHDFLSLNQIDAVLLGHVSLDGFKNDLGDIEPRLRPYIDRSREEILTRLDQFVTDPGRQIFFLRGDHGEGKTTLIEEFLLRRMPPTNHRPLYFNYRTYDVFKKFVEDFFARITSVDRHSAALIEFREKSSVVLAGIERTPTLFVIDNLDVLQYEDSDCYHAVTSDSLQTFIEEALGANSETKVIVSMPRIPDGMCEAMGASPALDSAFVGALSPQSWLRAVRSNSSLLNPQESKLLSSLVDQLGERTIPGSLLSATQVCLRCVPTESALAKVWPRLLRRSRRGMHRMLAQSLPENYLDMLRLIALTGDGLKRSTLQDLCEQLSIEVGDNNNAIESLAEVCAPILDKKFEDGEECFDLRSDLRADLIRCWEAYADREPRGRLGTIKEKRRAHRAIARLAYAAGEKERAERGEDKLESLKRYFQAFSHILASIDPQELKSISKRVSGVRRTSDEAMSAFVIGNETELDCIFAAKQLWMVDVGEHREHPLSNEFGADDLKASLLSRVFHIGFSFADSGQTFDFRQPHLVGSFQSDGPPLRSVVLLRDLLILIFEQFSISALRSHRFGDAIAALNNGLSMVRSCSKRRRNTYEAETLRFKSTYIDALARQGRLLEAEALAEETAHDYFSSFVLPRIDKFKGADSKKVSEGSRRTFKNLRYAIFNHWRVIGRLAEVKFYQGRLYAASKELRDAIEQFGRLQKEYGIDIEQILDGGDLVRRPTRHLNGTVARTLIRISIRMDHQMRVSPKILSGGEGGDRTSNLPPVAPQVIADWLTETASSMIGSQPGGPASWRHYSHEQAASLVDQALWHRHLLSGAGDKHRRLLRQLLNLRDEMKQSFWAGRVSPVTKLELLIERARIGLLYAQMKPEQRDIELTLAFRLLGRARWLARAHGYPLVQCDANLLLAEACTHDGLENKLRSELRVDSAELIGEAHEIIERCDYGLRWLDHDLLSAKNIAAPSSMLIC